MRAGEFNPGEIVPGTRYRVVGLVGAGGMGLVYDVEHLELGKRFVLKALLSDLAGREDIVARLRNEQRALGRLQHPNIVAVTDAGVTSTQIPFFVMERLEGETLGARLKRTRRLPVVEAIQVARGVLEGLSAAHEIGVVHRDIKPQNIFLSQGNRPKILDFGVAKIADAASVITARGVAIGTPRYMSPEQVGGEAVDGRSDLYAVGLVLFEMIAGKSPFDDARDSNEMLLAHLGKPAPRLASTAAGVTRELDALVASLLAKAPSDRPPTARAGRAALAAVLDRYGGGSNLDAPTPLGSYSSTTQSLVAPSGGPAAAATRPDGIAARDPVTVVDEKTSSGTTEVLPHAPGSDGTVIDEARAPGGTLYDPASRMVTVAHAHATMPLDAVRTERLETVAIPAPSDHPTHTRVPVTPSDGTPSLAPVRVEEPRSQRGRPLVRWVGAGAVVVLFPLAYLALRDGQAGSAHVPEPQSEHATMQPAPPQPVVIPPAEAIAEPARQELVAPSTPADAPVVPSASARSRPAVAAAPPSPIAQREKSAKAEGARAVRPPGESKQKEAKSAPSGAAIPLGLPGSGL